MHKIQLNEALKILNSNGYKLLKEGRYNEYSDIGMDPGWDDYESGEVDKWIDEDKFENTPELAACSEKYFGDKTYLASMCSANSIKAHIIYDYNGNGTLDSYEEGYYGIPFYYPNLQEKGKLGEATRKLVDNIINCIEDWDLDVDVDPNYIKENIKTILDAMDKACIENCENII